MSTTTQPIEFRSESLAATLALGRSLATLLDPGDVVALSGELGAGKTQLVRGVAEGLGADGRGVSSPTFVLMVEHPIDSPPVDRLDPPTALVHIDAYRMESLADMESIGFDAELTGGAVTLIEWAERIGDDLPADHLRIEIDHAAEGQRLVTLTPMGEWSDRAPLLRGLVRELSTPGRCPTCRGEAGRFNDAFPFCSTRCKMVDLNKWFSGDYKLSRPIEADDELTD